MVKEGAYLRILPNFQDFGTATIREKKCAQVFVSLSFDHGADFGIGPESSQGEGAKRMFSIGIGAEEFAFGEGD
jgi:hypothetical protein